MSRLSVPPQSPPPTKVEEPEKAPAPTTIPNGKAHDAKSPEPESESSSTPAPDAAPSPSPAPEPVAEEEEEDDQPIEEGSPIDMATFEQILELDEEDDTEREFSSEMVRAYFGQAGGTFDKLDEALDKKNLKTLSELGHFLKGSSAALGVMHVQATCERIQHYGKLRDEEANRDLTDEQALSMIQPLLKRVKKEYTVAEKWLRDWYGKEGISLDSEP